MAHEGSSDKNGRNFVSRVFSPLFYWVNSDPYSYTCSVQYSIQFLSSVAEPEPVEPKLFRDLEPEPKINLN